MPEKVNLNEKLKLFSEQWSPKLVGRVNDMHVKLVKISGEFLWHSHATEDELFLVVDGTMTMHFRDRAVKLTPGEFIIVPHGVEHMPSSETETSILLFEPATTVNTGTETTDRTREVVAI